MVAPVVLITTCGQISSGFLIVYNSVSDRMHAMTRERLAILRGPGGELLDPASVPSHDQERMLEIGFQLPLMLRRLHLTRVSLLVIYVAIGVLGLGIITIAIAVTEGSSTAGRVALALVLAGTVILLLGMAVA